MIDKNKSLVNRQSGIFRTTAFVCSTPAVQFVFKVTDDHIQLQLMNRSRHHITIDWNRIRLVNHLGHSDSITHRGTRFVRKKALQSPTIIPPQTMLTDALSPRNRGNEPWSFSSYLSSGKPLFLSVPLRIDRSCETYAFAFSRLGISRIHTS